MLDKIIKNKLLEVEILKSEQGHTISEVVQMNLPKNSFVESVRDKIKNGKNIKKVNDYKSNNYFNVSV